MGSRSLLFNPLRNSLRAGARQRRSLAYRPRSLQSARIILTAATQLTNLSTQPRNTAMSVKADHPMPQMLWQPPCLAGASFCCRAAITLRQGARVIEDSQASWCRRVRLSKKALWTRGLCKSEAGGGGGGSSQRWLVIEGSREHDDLERWYGGRALPWHRADLGVFGAHALSRCARVARMDSCNPLLATHFLLEKQVEARRYSLQDRVEACKRRLPRLVATAAGDRLTACTH